MAHEENSPLNITPGAIRFNTDSMKLEYFRIGMEGGSTSSYAGIGTMAAGEWVQITTDSPELHTGGTRAIFSGSYKPSISDAQCFINVDTTGNATDFGSFVGSNRSASATCGSRTRGLIMGGYSGSGHGVNEIDCNIFSSTGSAFDFGDLSESVRYAVGGSNSTRGIRAGGYDGSTSETIDYVTIAAEGGTAQSFGNLSASKYIFSNGACSQTRCIFPSGYTSGWTATMEYVTTSTQGNAADFGDQTVPRGYVQGISSSATRGLFFGGQSPSANSNIIDYVTLATLGNALDFGDMSYSGDGVATSCSPTRGVFAGTGPGGTNTIEYVRIATTGDAVDFGDLTVLVNGVTSSFNQAYGCAVSNGHGGLG